ncbi:putative AAA family ATPase [Candidatus Termititenax persephonae]|uniref:AAA family ATPase n=1 Tax=Candidatus Termititenax persephonae TaxID=2218525 RepID=A0A388THE0_9BACT|nr:putative AAA family ATPase [Candidatus Termititenax persephonae]
MHIIKKVKLHNFKRFKDYCIEFDEKLNLLIGDNESGKSSILSAIDLVLSGSTNKVKTLGLEELFNAEVVDNFLKSNKHYKDLPQLYVEIYLNEQNNHQLNGKYNSDGIITDGLVMQCKPNDEVSNEISDILNQTELNFPFEYYIISFKTFEGTSYTSYKKFLSHIIIDNSQISSEYAIKEYVHKMYLAHATGVERSKYQNEYRKHKREFTEDVLANLNCKITDYSFAVKNTSKANIETDLTLTQNSIYIENKGKGTQCFIKTEFALNKASDDLNVILLEEPENHLSHVNMKKLINKIISMQDKQLILTSHNSLISARLDLRKAILLNSNNDTTPATLKDTSEQTAKFFIKAPDNNILEFVLAKKVILVEGNAEYMLIEAMYEKIKLSKPADDNVHIISVGGISFKHYLNIAKILKIKTAVIRDNDKDCQSNCVDNYSNYVTNEIKVFFDLDNSNNTFEVCIYKNNAKICDDLFKADRKRLSVQDYMLRRKTEVAFKLLENKINDIVIPDYIQEAIKWISN